MHMVQELSGITEKLSGMKTAAIQMGDKIADAEIFAEKIDYLVKEVEGISQMLSDYEQKISQLTESHMEVLSENAKLRSDVKSMKIAFELEKQKSVQDDIIVCGLPKDHDVDGKDVLNKLCKKLNVNQSDFRDADCVKVKVTKIENKAVTEQQLFISSAPDLCAAIEMKCRESRKKGETLYASDLHEADSKVMCRETLVFHPVTIGEVAFIVKGLKNTSSRGVDGLTAKHFKMCSDYLCAPIAELINISFRDGKFPDILKIARITPIYKSGEKSNLSNYRPISVLPTLAKIFEAAAVNRIIDYVEQNEILSPSQYGFRPRSSTSSALFDVVDSIQMARDMNKPAKVTINASKTKLMVFGGNGDDVSLSLGSTQLESVSEFRYLGVILDDALGFGPHIDHLVGKLSSLTGAMRRSSGYASSRRVRLLVYNGLFESLMTYGAL
uniref:Putative tick transposon n=1 Tax=Lutzomyia longipalpis TaxID=7200 RepID=A0A1B0CEF1_LUTLO